MAHHASTPESVLTAPHRSFAWIVEYAGATRQERRHPDRAQSSRFKKAPHLWDVRNEPHELPRTASLNDQWTEQ